MIMKVMKPVYFVNEECLKTENIIKVGFLLKMSMIKRNSIRNEMHIFSQYCQFTRILLP